MWFRRLGALRPLALSLALAFSALAFAYVVYIDCDAPGVTGDAPDITGSIAHLAKPVGVSQHHVVGHHRRVHHRPSHRHVVYKCRIARKCERLGWMDPGAVPYLEDAAPEVVTTADWDEALVAPLEPAPLGPPPIPEPTGWILLILGFAAVAIRIRLPTALGQLAWS